MSVDWAALEKTGKAGGFTLAIPIVPPEVWGAGVTYRRSADFREEGLGIYDKIYEAPRPELFFKATASRSAGPHQPVGAARTLPSPPPSPRCASSSRVAAPSSATRWPTTCRPGTLSATTRSTSAVRRSTTAASRAGRRSSRRTTWRIRTAIEVTMTVSRGSTEVFKGTASTAS